MDEQQQYEAERHSALMAIQGALTAEESERFMAHAAARWSTFRLDCFSPADVLDYTDDYDEFLGETEVFFEQYGDRFPDSPAVRMAAHALLILGDGRISDLSVDGINDLLRRAGVLDPEHKSSGCPDAGACHHWCADGPCFRVQCCGPLSGVFPGDRWPADVLAANGAQAEQFELKPGEVGPEGFVHGRQMTPGERNELRHYLQVLSEQAKTVRNAIDPQTGASGFSVGQWSAQWRDLTKHLDHLTEQMQGGSLT